MSEFTIAVKVDGEFIICDPEHYLINTGEPDKLEPMDLFKCGEILGMPFDVRAGAVSTLILKVPVSEAANLKNTLQDKGYRVINLLEG